MKYGLRGLTLSILAAVLVLSIRLQTTQAKYWILTSGYHTPAATSTPTPPGCQTIPRTSIQVGAACFPQASCPAQDAFAHDPASNIGLPGIVCTNDGVNDCSSAVSKAIADGVAQGGHGDVAFKTPGTYLINLTSGGTYVNPWGIVPPSNAKIECAAGVTLKTTTSAFTTDAGEFSFANSNNEMCGCNYVGPQTGPGPMTITSVGSQNAFVQVIGGMGHRIEGNTISRVAGNSAIQLNLNHGSGGCPGSVTVQYNTFNLLPYYAVNIDCQSNNDTFSNNLVTDGDMGPEWDACPAGGSIGTNDKYIQNEIMVTTGNCSNTAGPGSVGCHGAGYLSNFSSAGSCNYSGVTFGGSAANANYCAGLPGSAGPQPLAAHYENSPIDAAPPATFSNNIIGPNCSCTGTSPC